MVVGGNIGTRWPVKRRKHRVNALQPVSYSQWLDVIIINQPGKLVISSNPSLMTGEQLGVAVEVGVGEAPAQV